MKIHVGWLLLCLAFCLGPLGAYTWYQASSIPDYGEAEPLVSDVIELSRELADIQKEKEVELADLKRLLSEARFAKIKPYGIVLSTDPSYSLSIRVNKSFSFKLTKEGHFEWAHTKGTEK